MYTHTHTLLFYIYCSVSFSMIHIRTVCIVTGQMWFLTYSPGGDTVEILDLLQKWLPIHSLPDAVEIVDNMPFTKHGKFAIPLSLYYK